MQSLKHIESFLKLLPDSFDSEDEIVFVTEDLSTDLIQLAYHYGVFPWPIEDLKDLIPWFFPWQRGILEFKDLHLSKSIQKIYRRQEFEIRFNKDFDKIIHQCALQERPGQSGTWINQEIIKTYCKLFTEGHAYCVGAYKDNFLVGGLYGVKAKNYYSGESMFFLHSNASKVCLIYLIEHLKNLDHFFLDIQMVTPLLENFGAKYISRQKFWNLIGL